MELLYEGKAKEIYKSQNSDEISPDTCRFWKLGTMDSLDKDVFREEKGSLIESYSNLATILGVK